ncbi:HD domain-containing protein [Terriglobus tenax]|uniref:HD domain-containing protein n=1 Tax=Terriglobus tenax TaxID=1111115 RepID=UPI0021E0657E|nr:HD domain-containing protein [Terriglobus tenax]
MSWHESIAAYLHANAQPQHKYGHQPRLYALTQQIGEGLTYDDDIVFAACFLHDLGVFIGHRPEDEAALAKWDHVAYTCEKSPSILREAGFPEEKIPAVLDVIRQHQPHDDPQTLEATLVRDADILEQLGAIGITRTLAKLGSDTRFVTFTNARDSLKKSLDNLPAKIRLDRTRELAEPRIRTLTKFLMHLNEEAGDNLY